MFSFRAVRSINLRKAGKVVVGLGISVAGIGTFANFTSLSAREKSVQELSAGFMAAPLSKALEENRNTMRTKMELMILKAQGDICRKLAEIEGDSFRVDRWERKEGGGGISCVIQDGTTLL